MNSMKIYFSENADIFGSITFIKLLKEYLIW